MEGRTQVSVVTLFFKDVNVIKMQYHLTDVKWLRTNINTVLNTTFYVEKALKSLWKWLWGGLQLVYYYVVVGEFFEINQKVVTPDTAGDSL